MGLAAWLTLGAALPSQPVGVTVQVAARDLAAGTVLAATDLRAVVVDPALATTDPEAGLAAESTAQSPADATAESAAGSVATSTVDPTAESTATSAGDPAAASASDPARFVGHRLAVPIAEGEVVTSTRLVPVGALSRLEAGTRAVHVPLADAGVAAAVRAGDRVDVIRTLDGVKVAAELVVLAVDSAPEPDRWGAGEPGNGGVLLSIPTDVVGPVVQAALGTGRVGGVHLAIGPRR